MSNNESTSMIREALAQVTASIRTDLSNEIQRLTTVREQQAEQAAEQQRILTEQIAAAVSQQVGTLEERGAEILSRVTEQITEQARAVTAQQVAEMNEGAANLVKAIRDEVRTAEQAKAAAEAERVAAEQAKAEAESKKAEAEKAVTLLTLAGDHEVKQAVALAEFQQREKETLAALKSERAAMEDRYSLEAQELQRGIMHYYPALAQRLADLADDHTEKESN